VIGAETIEQVRDNVALFEMEPLSANERNALEAVLGSPGDDLVDISRWKISPPTGIQAVLRP
jgi:hypothetical protein